MKLVVITDYGFVNGGASQVALSSLNLLAKSGIEVTLIFGVGPLDECVDDKVINVIDLKLSDLTSGFILTSALSGIWNFNAARKLKDILNSFDQKSTVIHIHSWTKSFSSSIFRVIESMNFKFILTLHDYFTVCPNGGFFNYKTKRHCNLKPMSIGCLISNCDSRNYFFKLWRFLRQLVQITFAKFPNQAKYFISVSSYSEAILKRFLPKNSVFYRLKNPISAIPFYSNPLIKNKVFCFVGRLSAEKGAKDFALAAKIAKVDSLFIGDGPDKNHIRNLNPNSVVTGWLSRDKVFEKISQSSVLVFPSLLHETQGLVVSEASALGVASLVSDGCAARDLIDNGKTGLLFKHGSIEDLVKNLTLLNSNDEYVNFLGENAQRNYWENPSTPELYVENLILIYDSLLKFS